MIVQGEEGEDKEQGYDDLIRSLGMWQEPVFIGKTWDHLLSFESLVHSINATISIIVSLCDFDSMLFRL